MTEYLNNMIEYQKNVILETNLQYFHNLFDSVINKDEESLKLFELFLLKYGISVIFNLIKYINYKKDKELLEYALNIYKNLLKEPAEIPQVETEFGNFFGVETEFGFANNLMVRNSFGADFTDDEVGVELIFGCSLEDDYFIVVKNFEEEFEIITPNSSDIIHTNKLNKIIKKYNKLIRKKWIPMNIYDIVNITKYHINNDTILTVPKIKKCNICKITLTFGISLLVFTHILNRKNRKIKNVY